MSAIDDDIVRQIFTVPDRVQPDLPTFGGPPRRTSDADSNTEQLIKQIKAKVQRGERLTREETHFKIAYDKQKREEQKAARDAKRAAEKAAKEAEKAAKRQRDSGSSEAAEPNWEDEPAAEPGPAPTVGDALQQEEEPAEPSAKKQKEEEKDEEPTHPAQDQCMEELAATKKKLEEIQKKHKEEDKQSDESKKPGWLKKIWQWLKDHKSILGDLFMTAWNWYFQVGEDPSAGLRQAYKEGGPFLAIIYMLQQHPELMANLVDFAKQVVKSTEHVGVSAIEGVRDIAETGFHETGRAIDSAFYNTRRGIDTIATSAATVGEVLAHTTGNAIQNMTQGATRLGINGFENTRQLGERGFQTVENVTQSVGDTANRLFQTASTGFLQFSSDWNPLHNVTNYQTRKLGAQQAKDKREELLTQGRIQNAISRQDTQNQIALLEAQAKAERDKAQAEYERQQAAAEAEHRRKMQEIELQIKLAEAQLALKREESEGQIRLARAQAELAEKEKENEHRRDQEQQEGDFRRSEQKASREFSQLHYGTIPNYLQNGNRAMIEKARRLNERIKQLKNRQSEIRDRAERSQRELPAYAANEVMQRARTQVMQITQEISGLQVELDMIRRDLEENGIYLTELSGKGAIRRRTQKTGDRAGKRKPAHLIKGSKAAKNYMRYLRSLRKK